MAFGQFAKGKPHRSTPPCVPLGTRCRRFLALVQKFCVFLGRFSSLITIKESLALSSKIFMGITVFNLIRSFIAGNVDEATEYILHNLVTIVVCVSSIVITNKLKINMWLKLMISYIIIVSILQGYTWLSEQLFRELPAGAHLGSFITTTIIFVIIGAASWAAEYMKVKKMKG